MLAKPYDTVDGDLLRQALKSALSDHGAAAGIDVSMLLDELAELQSLLQADGPQASSYELTLLRDMRELLTDREHQTA